MKHLIRIIMTTTFVLTLSALPMSHVYAAESASVNAPATTSAEDMTFGNLINAKTYVDEYGNTVTEQLFFYTTSGVSPTSETGSGTFTATKTIKWHENENHPESKYYAQGYFTWGNGDVSVTDAKGWIDFVPSLQTISNEQTTTGHGQYMGIFNNYATVTYSFTLKSNVGMSNDYSVTVRVSQSGNQI